MTKPIACYLLAQIIHSTGGEAVSQQGYRPAWLIGRNHSGEGMKLLDTLPQEIKKYLFYEEDDIVILCGDCLEILPLLEPESVDLVLTDPPYLNQHLEYGKCDIKCLNIFRCKQLIFWSARDKFPLNYSAKHIWNKMNGTITRYEMIYECNGDGKRYMVYSGQKIHNIIDARFAKDVVTTHPSQKPIKVIKKLINDYSEINNLILDPFLGSGTTAVAAKNLGRKCIGIEIEEKYCAIAKERLRQEILC